MFTRSRLALFSLFFPLIFVNSIFCQAQTATATCSNWTLFNTFAASGINNRGVVVGSAPQNDGSIDGYVRYWNRATRKYVDPNAAPPTDWTFLTKRNTLGVTVGSYRDANQYNHGLLLSGSGMRTLDYPGAVETILLGINKWNTIVGYWGLGDFSQPYDGFEMLKNGTVTTIAAPGAMQTNPTSISDSGVIVGSYVPRQAQPPFPDHGFVLANGVYKKVDYSNAQRTFLNDINSSGVIVGSWVNLNSGNSGGFLYANGRFKNVFGPEGETTAIEGINDYGYVTGTFSDGRSFIAHCQ